MGTAVALGVYLFLPAMEPVEWGLLLAFLCAAAVPLATSGERAWGPDPGRVVIDEIAGFYVTVAFLPQSTALGCVAFFLFRVLDIVKPPPARRAEALPGGVGIVADDVVAGFYGNLILQAGVRLTS